MSAEIKEGFPWPQSVAGPSVLNWEQAWCDTVVADVFGYHSLQLGLPTLQGLRTNRMPHRWLALPQLSHERHEGVSTSNPLDPQLYACPAALPFGPASLDLVLLPHALETCPDPHAALREAARVLVPEGRVLITGFSPVRWWRKGWQQRWLAHACGIAPQPYWQGIGLWRLRDWLHLLDFEIERIEHGAFRPMQWRWLQTPHSQWMETVGEHACPFLGAVYLVVAVKRVHGTRLLSAAWRQSARPAVQGVPVAHRAPRVAATTNKADE